MTEICIPPFNLQVQIDQLSFSYADTGACGALCWPTTMMIEQCIFHVHHHTLYWQ